MRWEVRKVKEQPDRGGMRETCFCKSMCKGPEVASHKLGRVRALEESQCARSMAGAEVQ